MARKRILLIDTSSILHVVKHSGAKQIKEKDKSTYIIFGFLLKLHLLMQKTKASVCVFATDSLPENSIRRKLYPSYKLKRNSREKSPEEEALDKISWPQFDAVEQDVLPLIGYSNVFNADRLEADDIIGRICKTYTNCEIIIVTSDQDMYQLLTPSICILKPKTASYYTKAMFEKEYGIEPKMWKRVKAIGGCNTDEVKGVPIPQLDPKKKQRHVAEKTALKYIKGELPSHHQTFKAIESKEGRKIINRNKPLVILPFTGTPKFKIQPDRISKIKIKGIAEKYGFKSISMDLEKWIKVLKGWS